MLYTGCVTDFAPRLEELRRDIVAQGKRVFDIVLKAVEAYFDLDKSKALLVIKSDDEIDRVDVEIERASIPLLALGVTDEYSIRSVLTIVKINNELERIADAAVSIAEIVKDYPDLKEVPSDTFRVMANSVIGMLRDANRAVKDSNTALAQQVLLFDDTVARFKEEISLNSQEQVAAGKLSVQFAFRLTAVTKAMERISDYCTNICEQVIYLQSGKIVRHRPEGWTNPSEPS
ncbi:MAG: phosphate signaling complex protein PhoU [Phycisphaerales bacterium]|nr:phosphate signaling complex protein PhoU [Phycisphaerales bacterium]